MYTQPNFKMTELSAPLSVQDAINETNRCIDKFGFGVHCVTDCMNKENDLKFLPGFCNVHTHGLDKFCGHEIRLVRYFYELDETPVVLANIINQIGGCIVKYYGKENFDDAYRNIFDQSPKHEVFLPPEQPGLRWRKIGVWEPDIDEKNVIRIIRETALLEGSDALQRCPLRMYKVLKEETQ